MDNFFNFAQKTDNSELKKDSSLQSQYNNLKNNYEHIFVQAAESIRKELSEFRPENACTTCNQKDCQLKNAEKDVFAPYPGNCKYREWQLQAISFLAGDYRQKLKAIYKNIMNCKNDFNCAKCGNCCRLATSEYSYEQLKQRAMRGDKFAQDFVSVFVPYKTEAEAQAANPEYFKLINELMEEDKIYYYHCPKVEGNLCSDYENRPNICKDFPHNPLKLLPSNCAFNEWKRNVSKQAMLLKAKVDIIQFYNEKLT